MTIETHSLIRNKLDPPVELMLKPDINGLLKITKFFQNLIQGKSISRKTSLYLLGLFSTKLQQNNNDLSIIATQKGSFAAKLLGLFHLARNELWVILGLDLRTEEYIVIPETSLHDSKAVRKCCKAYNRFPEKVFAPGYIFKAKFSQISFDVQHFLILELIQIYLYRLAEKWKTLCDPQSVYYCVQIQTIFNFIEELRCYGATLIESTI